MLMAEVAQESKGHELNYACPGIVVAIVAIQVSYSFNQTYDTLLTPSAHTHAHTHSHTLALPDIAHT